MTLPLSTGLIAEANPNQLVALEEDHDALGRKLSRTGFDIDAIKARVAGFSVAVFNWGAGRGGTQFAKFPIAGEPTNVHEKLEDCAVINQLCGSRRGLARTSVETRSAITSHCGGPTIPMSDRLWPWRCMRPVGRLPCK